MFGTKIEKHGVFFRKGRLRTECKCGCVYHTPKRRVKMEIYHSMASYYIKDTHQDEAYFETTCPECLHENKQWRSELEAANA